MSAIGLDGTHGQPLECNLIRAHRTTSVVARRVGNDVAANYIPSWTEIAVSIGVLSYALLAFTLGVKYLPLFPRSSHIDEEELAAEVALASGDQCWAIGLGN